MKQISKPNDINNLTSLKKDNNIVIAPKQNKENILGSFYFSQWTDTKEIKSFIKNIEKQVRTSKEYTAYIGHLNNEIGIHSCAVFGNLTDEIEGLTLEYHHYPFTLYDIVETVVNKKIINDERFTTFDVTDEVLKLHQKNHVGLVKLCKTAHELVHAGQIYVNLKSVFGDVNSFINVYSSYIPDETIINYNKLIDMSKHDYDEHILEIINYYKKKGKAQ